MTIQDRTSKETQDWNIQDKATDKNVGQCDAKTRWEKDPYSRNESAEEDRRGLIDYIN